MRYSISDVAEYGDLLIGTRIVDDSVRERMKSVLEEIRSGDFARQLFEDDAAGRPRFKELREQGAKRAADLEKVGKELRELAGVQGLHGHTAQ
jgi:ketol-acid reductoisomerase